jgi:hypothetical protein
MTYQPHQSEDVTMKPVAGMNIDEAALKAGISEPAAFMWQHDETGSVGFVDPWQVANGWQEANPRLKIIGPLYTHPAPVAVVPAEQAEDSAMRKDAMRYRWLRAGNYPISFARSVLNDTPHGIDASIDAEMSGESRK